MSGITSCPRSQPSRSVRERREQLGLTQAELAGRIGLSVRGLRNIERGLAKPRFPTVLVLSIALGVEPGELMPEDPNGP